MSKKTDKTSGPLSEAPAPKTRKPRAKAEEPSAKKKAPVTKPAAAAPKKAAATAKARTAGAKTKTAATAKAASARTGKTPAKTKAPSSRTKKSKEPAVTEYQLGDLIIDPIGDTTDGEARQPMEPEPESEPALLIETVEAPEAKAPETREAKPAQAPPPAHLERLQKILSQAGIASRRHAEELIVAGRVVVNGQVVNTLGAKADPARDHIRVDGKLLQGAERHRYFVLNKPRGYVTTVSDPEGRPTVMEFFSKMPERLYPVGRLDYQSEGLLLMTNDGELANQLTRAASGVEKTYLVKVAGQPTEDVLEQLRTGVAIERGKPGSPRVRTSPAQIRQVRQGDNPWFEVVLIEGRNRELRKMFSAVGHFVEKIRRVGYGPLVLDQEPGNFRELDPEELTALRLTAEGKLKPRRMKTASMLPREAGRTAAPQERKGQGRGGKFFRPAEDRPQRTGPRPPRPGFAPRAERPEPRRSGPNPSFSRPQRPQSGSWQGSRPGFNRPEGERSGAQSGFGRQQKSERFASRPSFDRPQGQRPEGRTGGFAPKSGPPRPFRGERPSFEPRPRFDRPAPAGKPRFEPRPQRAGKPQFDRPASPGRPRPESPGFEQPSRKPFRPREERPFTPRSDRPAKPFGKPAGKSFSKGPGRGFEQRPQKSWNNGPGRPAPRPAGSGPQGPAPSFRSKPRPGGAKSGGFSKPGHTGPGVKGSGFKGSGFKGKPTGGKRTFGAPRGNKRG